MENKPRGLGPEERANLAKHLKRKIVELIEKRLAGAVDLEAQTIGGDTALTIAASTGREEYVVKLLAAGANLDAQTDDGKTALILAAAHGHDEIVAKLLAAGANIDAQTKDGKTALTIAAESGHEEIVAKLLAAGANPDAQTENGDTALILAAQSGHEEIVAKLLAAGANVDVKSKYGNTALISAVYTCQEGNVAKLLAAGANLDAQENDGKTALTVAARSGHDGIVAKLLAVGANLDAQLKDGKTALIIAAKRGHEQIVAKLLAAGANVAKQARDGWTALMWAAGRGHKNVVAKMLAADTGSGDYLNMQSQKGCTALFLASYKGNQDVVALLLGAGADPNVRTTTDRGMTALTVAASNGHTEVVKKLLAAGINADVPSVDGWTALMFAAVGGHGATVAELLAARADLSTGDKNGWTTGANTNVQCSKHGQTALMLAASKGNEEIVTKLLDAGADPNLESKTRKIAFVYADEAGHTQISALLKPECVDPISMEYIPKKYRVDLKDSSERGFRTWDARSLAKMFEAGQCVHPLSREPLSEDVQAKIKHINEGRTHLESAILRSNCEEVDRLSKRTSKQELDERKLISFAIRKLHSGDNRDRGDLIRIVKSLLLAGAPVGLEELLAASDLRNMEVWEMLWMVARPDPSECGNMLLRAAGRCNLPLTRFLVERGVDPNGSPLIVACNLNTLDVQPMTIYQVVRTLVEGGARVDNDAGHLALHAACFQGNVRTIKYLIDVGADVNARVDGETALTRATFEEVITLLLAVGATEGFDKALEKAKKDGKKDIVAVLELCRKVDLRSPDPKRRRLS